MRSTASAVPLTIMSYNRRGLVEGLDGPFTHVAVAAVRPLGVVVDQPSMEPLPVVEVLPFGEAIGNVGAREVDGRRELL